MPDARVESPRHVGLGRGSTGEDVRNLQRYLTRFGYLEPPGGSDDLAPAGLRGAEPGRFDEVTERALRRYQAFHGLQETGELDGATLEQTSVPRCGNPDVPEAGGAVAAFVPFGTRWDKLDITFGFENFTSDLSQEEIRGAIGDAFSAWAAVTRLTFTEVPVGTPPDLRIRFATGDHGDGVPFDGRWGTYAHAFYPKNGRTHFDDAEDWAVSAGGLLLGPDLETIAIHEIGHALGLKHSSVGDAIMRPTFGHGGRQRWLHHDDIAGIQYIYGSPVGDWASIGGGLTSDPAVCTSGRGQLDVFARGEDNAIWHIAYDDGWGDWRSIGGGLTSGPAACTWGPGRLDVFARGEDNAIWHIAYDGGWGDWRSIGGGLTSGPAACTRGPGRLNVFARGEDNAIWHNTTFPDGGWIGWASLGGGLTSGPAACTWQVPLGPLGRLDVLARGEDNAIWHTFSDARWGGWRS